MPSLKSRSLSRASSYGYKFPYVKFHGRSYPLIPVRLSKNRIHLNTFALLDSGASISVFRPEIAKALSIPLKKKGEIRLGTANGGVNISLASIDIIVGNSNFKSKVGFSKEVGASFNIIGRQGFFDKFKICFNEMNQHVFMMPHLKRKK